RLAVAFVPSALLVLPPLGDRRAVLGQRLVGLRVDAVAPAAVIATTMLVPCRLAHEVEVAEGAVAVSAAGQRRDVAGTVEYRGHASSQGVTRRVCCGCRGGWVGSMIPGWSRV